MSVQSEIDRIITAVGNAYSKVSEKGGTVPASQTVANLATAIGSIPSGGAKETWVIKSDATGVFATTQISFTSNGQKFTSIGANDSSGFATILYYDNNEIAGYDPNSPAVYDFDNEAYRKLTFDTPPAGALLTWLQSNATKQPDDTAVQNTKAVTITSNGTVSVTPDAPYDGLSSVDVTVNVASGGGGGGDVGGVSFIDYDGTIVETWALSDLASKTELPTPPAHDRLVFQQWNWTLEDIKSANAEMTVGALYTTASGLTEFHIRVTKVSGLTITCNMVGNKNWGDGTEDALTSHTYADYGDYIITCGGDAIASKVMGDVGSVMQTLLHVSIPNSVTSIGDNAFSGCYALQSVSIPNSVTSIGYGTFSSCYALQSASIPNSVTSIGDGAFYSCYALQSVSIPNSITSIGDDAFSGCYALQSVSIPNSVTSIGDGAFYYCYALQSVSISNSVTSIGNGAFSDCSALQFDFSQFSEVPTIGSQVFDGIFSSARILVPSSLYDTWVAATEWSTYANYIVGV